jgi:hypothetical protein
MSRAISQKKRIPLAVIHPLGMLGAFEGSEPLEPSGHRDPYSGIKIG